MFVLTNYSLGKLNNMGIDFSDIAERENEIDRSLEEKSENKDYDFLWNNLGNTSPMKHSMICDRCCSLLVDYLKKELISQQEFNFLLFQSLLEMQIEKIDNIIENEDLNLLDQEIERLQKEVELEEEKVNFLDLQIVNLKKAKKQLDSQAYLHQSTLLNLKFLSNMSFEESLSLEKRIDTLNRRMQRLERVKVWSFIFKVDIHKITKTDYMGTINGLRLGYTNDFPVSWQEFNEALGLSALYFFSTFFTFFSNFFKNAQINRKKIENGF